MNIDVNTKINTNSQDTQSKVIKKEDNSQFSEELSSIASSQEKVDENTQNLTVEEPIAEDNINKNTQEENINQNIQEPKIELNINTEAVKNEVVQTEAVINKDNVEHDIQNVCDGLADVVFEINNKLSQKDDKTQDNIKDIQISSDKKDKDTDEENGLINNDMNITPEKTDALTFQMNANMNFNSNEQPFSEYINNQENQTQLNSSANDLEEEKAILSTMDENLAIAQKNQVLAQINQPEIEFTPTEQNNTQPQIKTAVETQNKNIHTQTKAISETQIEDFQPQIKTVTTNDSVKKVDVKSNIKVETIVKYDSVIMDKNDVEFFANLVNNGQVDAADVTEKSARVSKTLADLIAKSMQDNKPVRIDFDNNISIIIKITKDGKISADFLPSSQVAEAYLKENLPLLRQRFDENNIEYEELNQRKQRQDEKQEQKKGRRNE